jgi:hypothetical protein
VIRFQQYDNYPIATDGFAFDDVSVTGGGGGGPTYITAESEPNNGSTTADGPVGANVAVSGTISSSSDDDWFWFDVGSAGTIAIVLNIGSSADLDWYLYTASNPSSWVARGYTVNNPESGTYSASPGGYFLRVDGYQGATSSYTLTIGGAGILVASGGEKTDASGAIDFALGQNAPNPFRLGAGTTIDWAMPDAGSVTLEIFDVTGRRVRTLVNGSQKAGRHSATWDGRNDLGNRVASGVYLYRIDTPGFQATKKMMLSQ